MPTIKQKRVFKKALKGIPISQAMREEGYSLASSKATVTLTRTQGWQELLNKHLNDDFLAKKHRELLEREEVVVKNNNETGQLEVIKTGQLDVQAVKAGLDMAYKLKGAYIADKKPPGDSDIPAEVENQVFNILNVYVNGNPARHPEIGE